MRQVPRRARYYLAINGLFLIRKLHQEWAICSNVTSLSTGHLPHWRGERGLPGVVVEAHVVVAAVVLELLPVLAVFARGQQDDVVAVVQVVQRVAEKGREDDNISPNMSRMPHSWGTYFFVRGCVKSTTWLLFSCNLDQRYLRFTVQLQYTCRTTPPSLAPPRVSEPMP